MSDGLSIQISDLDSYHSTPSHLDQFQQAPKVPIIRIYGTLRVPDSELAAYNILVHIHNYYPYLYIDCLETDDAKLNDDYLHRLTLHLEKSLAESFQRKANVQESADDSSDGEVAEPDADIEKPQNRFIASIRFCRGSPVYGYHVGYAVVLKISFFSPLYKTRLFKLLSSNAVSFKDFSSSDAAAVFPNVYEAHLNYLSQFLADFNLHPCGYLNTNHCHFRSPVVNHNGLPISPLKEYLSTFILDNNVLNSDNYPRMSRSLLEIDCHVGSILNRLDLRERNVHNDFTEYTKGSEKDIIFLSSLRITLDDLKYQCAVRERENTSQLLKESYSQVFTKLGQSGYCDWESRPQHEQQLTFVSRLNKPTPFFDVELFYENAIQGKLRGIGFPTVFELVGETLPLKYYEDVPLLNYRDDLVKWSSYEQLFELQNDVFPEPIVDFSPSGSVLESATMEYKDKHTTPPPSPKDLYSPNGAVVSSPLTSPVSKRILSPEMDGPSEKNSELKKEDLQIFMLTQRNTSKCSQGASSSSAGSIFSQTTFELLKNPGHVWEFAIPSGLQKKNFSKIMNEQQVLDFDYPDPSYDDMTDVHHPPLVFANKILPVPLEGESSKYPISFSTAPQLSYLCVGEDDTKAVANDNLWQFAVRAPTRNDVARWLNVDEKSEQYKRKKFRSQIEPLITQTNDFKYSLRAKNVARNPSGFLNMTLFGMELHANTMDGMRPDPKKDPIRFIIYHFDNSNQMYEDGKPKTAILVFAEETNHWVLRNKFRNIATLTDTDIRVFSSEKQMVENLVRSIDLYDPDILSGYEVNASSWGYLCERYQESQGVNLIPRLSKVSAKGNGKFGDRWGYTHTSSLKINGRHLFNVWRFLKEELKLTSYSLENISFHLLHRTLPKISSDQLSEWYTSGSIGKLLMVCNYFKHRMDLTMDIIDSQEMVLRNVESSRLLGVDFYSNYYRGSQFKVESLLMRIAKTENALLNSPSKTHVHAMRPLEVVPLIMEPESNFYKSPLVVLDFQSLYPSIMIAYNYCYSTLIGRLEGYRQEKNTVGYLQHHDIPKGLIDLLWKNGGLNISPNGMMFVSPNFRKSILSRMLQEILNMRINVKAVASAFRGDKELGKLLNSKQLALKLIANVTYGYTSATFSGRMPNSDIADAIVSTGRELMKRSIEMIEASPYNAKVTYGDTDSLFVYFPGRSREYAFKHGKLLAKMITEALPDPVKLKFEKVYHPSVLLAKKRYVGHCYEFEDQITPTFEAKGIETIRRDGIPAQSKMVGKSLRILFETKNLSAVKKYVIKQFFKILLNRVNASDFCFAKGVRYGTYKNERYLPPGAVVAKKNIQRDPRSEPQYRERVPYLVMRDSTKERLRDRCVPPEMYMASYNTDNPMELDFEYYITKVLIPPLERVFNLMGVNVKEWYREMPKSTKSVVMKRNDILKISGFMRSEECVRCGSKLGGASRYLCQSCKENELELVNDLTLAGREKEEKVQRYQSVCSTCSSSNFEYAGSLFSESCVNQDCRTYYAKVKSVRESEQFMSDKFKILKELEASTTSQGFTESTS